MLRNFYLQVSLFFIAIVTFFPVNAASLVGTWKLSGFEVKHSSKKNYQCYSPTGLLTYTSSGYVAVGFNCMKNKNSNEPSFKLADMTFYTGKYRVEGENVIHLTQNGSSSDYYDKKLTRHIDLLTDKQLVLSLSENDNRYIVKWDRVG